MVDFTRLDLFLIVPPRRGYHYASVVAAAEMPQEVVRLIWDDGAEASKISGCASSRILRAQAQLSPERRRALVDLCRFTPQTFHGYDHTAEPEKVDVFGFARFQVIGGDGSSRTSSTTC